MWLNEDDLAILLIDIRKYIKTVKKTTLNLYDIRNPNRSMQTMQLAKIVKIFIYRFGSF